MKRLFKKIKKKHILFVFLFIFLSFLIVNPVYASTWITKLFGWVFAAIISFLGLFLMMLIVILTHIAQYNDFINSDVISRGWAMTRDIANMFFVVILLIIAFATILRIQKYDYKKWLPKLVLMAVLINFSKMICGLMIDAAQIIMLSFVNSFKTMSGTNIVTMLGIKDWHTLRNEPGDTWRIMGAYFLAVVYVIISIIVIFTMVLMLLMRIIMIWIYVVLSPLAFLLGSFPDGQSYASKWWTQFSQNLIVGPVLAFFIWLSFSVVNYDDPTKSYLGENMEPVGDVDPTYKPEEGSESKADGFGAMDLMVQFFVSIGLLIGGLKVSQEIGGAAGSMAGKGMGKIQQMGQSIGKKGASIGKGATKFAGRKIKEGAQFTGRQALGGIGKGLSALGGKFEGSKAGGRLTALGELAKARKEDGDDRAKKRKVERREDFLKKMGFGDKSAGVISSQLDKSQKEGGWLRGFKTTKDAADSIADKSKKAKRFTETFGKGDYKDKEEDRIEFKQNISSSLGKNELFEKGDGIKNTKQTLESFANDPSTINNFKGYLEEIKGMSGGVNNFDKDELVKFKNMEKAIEKGEEQKVKGIDNLKDVKEILKDLNVGKHEFDEVAYNKSAVGEERAARVADPKGDQIRDFDNSIKALTAAILKGGGFGGGSSSGDSTELKGRAMMSSKGPKSIGGKGQGKKGKKKKGKKTKKIDPNKGKMFTNSFANGEVGGKKGDRETIFMDFEKLKKEGINIDSNAEGMSYNGKENSRAALENLAKAIVSQIDQAKLELDKDYKDNKITKEQYEKEMSDLDGAKQRLNNGDYNNLSLVNTGHAEFSAAKYKGKNALAGHYHETLHNNGLESEYLTHTITDKIFDKGITGEKNVKEIGFYAAKLESEGIDDGSILKHVDERIEKLKEEESNRRAEIAVKIQSADKQKYLSEIDKTNGGIRQEKTQANQVLEKKAIEEQDRQHEKDFMKINDMPAGKEKDEEFNKTLKASRNMTYFSALNEKGESAFEHFDALKGEKIVLEQEKKKYEQNIKEGEEQGDGEKVEKNKRYLESNQNKLTKVNEEIKNIEPDILKLEGIFSNKKSNQQQATEEFGLPEALKEQELNKASDNLVENYEQKRFEKNKDTEGFKKVVAQTKYIKESGGDMTQYYFDNLHDSEYTEYEAKQILKLSGVSDVEIDYISKEVPWQGEKKVSDNMSRDQFLAQAKAENAKNNPYVVNLTRDLLNSKGDKELGNASVKITDYVSNKNDEKFDKTNELVEAHPYYNKKIEEVEKINVSKKEESETKKRESKKETGAVSEDRPSSSSGSGRLIVQNEFKKDELEGVIEKFAGNLDKLDFKEIANLGKKLKVDNRPIIQSSTGPKFNQVNFLRLINRSIEAGNTSLVKAIKLYQLAETNGIKVSQLEAKKAIIKELKKNS